MLRKNNVFLYIPYFLDSLSGGSTPFLFNKKTKIKKGCKWEKRLLSNSDGYVVMKSSERHHINYSSDCPHYSKIKVLDIPLITDNIIDNYQTDNNKTVFTYIGSLPLKIRNPFYGLDLLSRLKNIEIRMVGPIPDSDTYKEFCKSHDIILLGPKNHLEINDLVKDTDILINFGNNIKEMVPSKIFEYISYLKPILSFAPIEDEPSIPYLEKYPLSCVIHEEDPIDANMMAIKRFMSNKKNISISKELIQNTFYNNTPAAFADYIDEKFCEFY